MRRLRTLLLPPWRRAPLRMLSSPSLFASVAVAACVLALAAASKPMFVSASASAALHQDLVRGCRYNVGLTVAREGEVPGTARPPLRLRQRPPVDPETGTRALDGAVAGIEGVAPAVVTAHGGVLDVVAPSGPDATVQLVARTGAPRYVDVREVADATDGRGIWLPDTVADALGVDAGARVAVRGRDGATVAPLTVAGVFRDLAGGERRPFWCSTERLFEEFQLATPPPVALVERSVLLEVLREAGVPSVGMRWEYAPDPDGWVLDRATRAIAELSAVAAATNNDELPLGRLFQRGPASVDQASTVRHAERAAAIVDASAGPVALGAAGVALLVLVLAARSWLDRRRQELVVLALRGAGPGLLAAKGVLEMATPVAFGGAAGIAAAVAVVELLAPSGLVDGGAIGDAAVLVALAVAAALAAVAVAVLTGVRRVAVEPLAAAGATRVPPWEPLALGLAAAALYELRTRGSSVVDGTRVDSLVLLLPVLLLAGGAGVVARIATSRTALRRGGHWPMAPWLAVRRLAIRRNLALPVITGAAVAIGLVVFATTTGRSLRATVDAKARLGPGATQVLLLERPAPLPAGRLLADATAVTRTAEGTVVVEGHTPADVLGVDPATFARAAFWDGSFADRSLDALLEAIDVGDREARDVAPAVAVGAGLPQRFALTLPSANGAARVRVRVVARAEAFPGYGYNSTRPLVVVDRDVLTGHGVVNRAEVWVDSDRPAVVADAVEAGLPVASHFVVAGDTDQGNLEAQVWALEYLEVVGLAAGAVTLSGLGSYFAANAVRRRAASALAGRLGVRRVTAIGALALEVAAMLGVGLVSGIALAWLAVRMVFERLDPLPNAPPAPILRLDLSTVAATVATVVAVAAVVALVVEWRSRSAPLPRLLRDAG